MFLTFCPVSMCPYDVILGEFKKTFSHLAFEGSAAKRLNEIKSQAGKHSAAEFIIDFCTVGFSIIP